MTRPKVALLVTCLVDMFRPQVGFAAVKLLEDSGCDVTVPEQTCCGQPAYNAGDQDNAKALAQNVIAAFESFDYVVAPSGSCAGMLMKHYPLLFADDPLWKSRAEALAEKSHELLAFLVNVRGLERVNAACPHVAVYHDSCSSLREAGSAKPARALLSSVDGLRTEEIADAEVCCGFGGLFSVKFPEISARMADDKLINAQATGSDLLVGPDLGCLLHLAGRLSRNGETMEVRHVAEVLAGMMETPAIGRGPK